MSPSPVARVMVIEPILACIQPLSTVYIRVHSEGLDKCTTCIYSYSVTKSRFTALKIFSALPVLPLLPSTPWSIVLSFPKCHIVEIIQYSAFSDLLLWLSNMHLASSVSFHGLVVILFSCWIPLHCLDVAGSVRSPTEGRLRCFQGLPVMTKASINICVQVFCGLKFSFHLSK